MKFQHSVIFLVEMVMQIFKKSTLKHNIVTENKDPHKNADQRNLSSLIKRHHLNIEKDKQNDDLLFSPTNTKFGKAKLLLYEMTSPSI